MKKTRPNIFALVGLFVFAFSHAEVPEDAWLTPELTVEIPKDHVFLVAIDDGAPCNRPFSGTPRETAASGVEPILARWMRKPATVSARLALPDATGVSQPCWTLRTGFRYQEFEASSGKAGQIEIGSDWDMHLDYVFTRAARYGRLESQSEGVDNEYGWIPLEETVPPRLEKVEAGITGVEFYQIPFAKGQGAARSVVIVVAESLEKASKSVVVPDAHPIFEWSSEWFHETGTGETLSDFPEHKKQM